MVSYLPLSKGQTSQPRTLPITFIALKRLSASADRATVELLQRLNARHLEKFPGDANLAGRIASYELAGKMQTSVPDVMDLSGETEATLQSYGVEGGSELKGHYARNCILARRLLEKGVRIVQLFNGSDPAGGNGITNWDSHSDIAKTHAMQAEIMDQPTAALIADLKQRGMLEHTLVVWATEFGRMPFLQANGTGRDHNPDAFTCFHDRSRASRKDSATAKAMSSDSKRLQTKPAFTISMPRCFT